MNSEQEKILNAWCQLLQEPPEGLVNLLVASVKDHKGSKSLTSSCQQFLQHFLKNIHDPEFMARLPKRRISPYRVFVDTNTGGNYDFTKPASFTFECQKHHVRKSTWKNLLIQLCELIAKDNPREFHRVIDNFFGNRRGSLFSKMNILGDGRLIPGTDIYVETRLSANNIQRLCDELLRYFGYGYTLEVETE